MKYCSVDIETTGLDSEKYHILSVGIVIEDTNNILPIDELPKLHIGIVRDEITGSMFAINLNKELISNILKFKIAQTQEEKDNISEETKTVYLTEDKVVEKIFQFLWDNNIRYDNWEKNWGSILVQKTDDGKIYPLLTSNIPKTFLNIAGKNFGTFDKLFLEKLPRWKHAFQIRNRILDPAILYIDWINDDSVPGLDKCKQRAGIDGIVTHNAIDDAIDVIKLLRKTYER